MVIGQPNQLRARELARVLMARGEHGEWCH